jgi:hypothetical protein
MMKSECRMQNTCACARCKCKILTSAFLIPHSQYFTKSPRSGDFSRFLPERLKSLLRFRDLLILHYKVCELNCQPNVCFW